MKKEKNTIPYIITIYGTVNMAKKDIEDIRQELNETDIQYLIKKADSKYVELDEDEFKNMMHKEIKKQPRVSVEKKHI